MPIMERRGSIGSISEGSDEGPRSDDSQSDESEEQRLRRKCLALEAELEIERNQRVRGTNKFMGGGQFKVSGGAKNQKQCGVCFTLRDTMQKMQIETDEVKQTNIYLISEVERLKAELDTHYAHLNGMGHQNQQAAAHARKLEAEIDLLKKSVAEHQAAAGEARGELEKKTAAFDAMMLQRERDAKQLAEQIRKLQEQLVAREREVEMFKQTAQQFEQRTAEAVSKTEKMEIQLNQSIRERELQAGQIDRQEQLIQDLESRLEEFAALPKIEDRSEYIERLEKRIADLEARLKGTLADLEATRGEVAAGNAREQALRDQLQACQADLRGKEAEVATLQKELEAARGRNDELVAANEDLTRVSQEMVSTIDALEETKKTLEDKVEALERELEELRNSTEEGDKWRKILEEKEYVISELQREIQQLTARIAEQDAKLKENRLDMEALREDLAESQQERAKLEKEIENLKKMLKDLHDTVKKQADEAAKSEVALEKAKVDAMGHMKVADERKEKIVELNKKLAEKDKAILDLMEKHARNLEKAKQDALEKTMQSMVRLCVVAPTVNVSFGSEALTCKAGLPGERIHEIIETQILPGFIQLFLQPKEGLGPDGGQLSKWVERLMGDMQSSIEKHLAGVFSTANHEKK